MATDKAKWHYDGDFPEELPMENGGTHIGMFLAWIINNNLQGEFFDEEMPEAIADLRNRKITGREFLFESCDGQLIGEELSEEGLKFSDFYYDEQYISDYEKTLAANLPSVYHVEDRWKNYDEIAPIIDKRFNEWKQSQDI